MFYNQKIREKNIAEKVTLLNKKLIHLILIKIFFKLPKSLLIKKDYF